MAIGNTDNSLPGLKLPPLTTYPVDGYGGSYYNVQFPVPVYSSRSKIVLLTTSWSDIDEYYHTVATSAVINAVCFGVCITTLFNAIILTPQSKRKLPFHKCICSALACQIVRNTTSMILATKSLPASSYAYLTYDLKAVTMSHTYRALVSISEVSACFSFALAQACLFIQVRALLTWLRVRYNRINLVVLVMLVSAGSVALCFRLGTTVLQIKNPLLTEVSRIFDIFWKGALVTGAVSIGSWSLVFFTSTVSTIIHRRRNLFSKNTLYDATLNFIAVIGLESFVIPIFFCILQLIDDAPLTRPEQLIVPSVLFLLPIGSLFFTIHDESNTSSRQILTANACECSSGQSTSDPEAKLHCPSDRSDFNLASDGADNRSSAMGMVEANGSGNGVVNKPRGVADPFEVELALIDALDDRKSKIGAGESEMAR